MCWATWEVPRRHRNWNESKDEAESRMLSRNGRGRAMLFAAYMVESASTSDASQAEGV